MPKLRRILVACTATLVVIAANLVIAELLLGLYNWQNTGKPIWTRAAPGSFAIEPEVPQAAEDPVKTKALNPYKAAEDPIKTKMALHPYFGDNTRTGTRLDGLYTDRFYMERITGLDYLPSYYNRLTVNNHGFWGPHDYPYRPKQDEFVVGIFGGSFAFHFWLSTLDERSSVLKRFAAATGKRVVFLNFTSGGRKQPQTLLQLAYFMAIGQQFDFILNLDGFNEILDGWKNLANYNVDYSMPFAEFAFKIQNAFLEQAFFGGDQRVSALVTRRREWASRADGTRSALVYYLANLLSEYYGRRLNALETQLKEAQKDLRYPMQLVPSETKDFDEVVPKIADLWLNGSIAMQRLLVPASIPYLHVLQPNQYFSAKRLTAQEQEWDVRGAAHLPLARIVPQIYRAYLQRGVSAFAQLDLAFVDATPVYDQVADTVFIDWCCHVNENGNRILSALIEPKMIALLARTSIANQ